MHDSRMNGWITVSAIPSAKTVWKFASKLMKLNASRYSKSIQIPAESVVHSAYSDTFFPSLSSLDEALRRVKCMPNVESDPASTAAAESPAKIPKLSAPRILARTTNVEA